MNMQKGNFLVANDLLKCPVLTAWINRGNDSFVSVGNEKCIANKHSVKQQIMATKKATSIDEYIAGFPKETQKLLQQIRAMIKNTVPAAEETISYAIPTFTLNNTYLIYFAGYKNHISIYPVPTGNAAFEKEIAGYKSGKGTAQFSLEKPLPVNLIIKIIKYSLKQNLKKQKSDLE